MATGSTDSPTGYFEGAGWRPRRALTARQAEILGLIAGGLSDKQIAARLSVSQATIRSHLQRMYREHGFKNRADAAVAWTTYRSEHRAGSPVDPRRRPAPWWRFPLGIAAAALLGAAGLMVLLHPAVISPTHAIDIGMKTQASKPAVTVTASRAPSSAHPAVAMQAAAPVAGTGPPAVAPAVPRPTPAAPSIQVEAAVGQLALINQDRAAALQPALQWNACLASSAAQVAELVAEKGSLAGISGIGPDLGCGLSVTRTENAGSWPGINDAQMNAAFMADPIERGRILGAYHWVGAAWARTPSGTAFLVVEFA